MATNKTLLGNVKGPPGPAGVTPHIGENGNWWIGEVDTGVPASGGGGGSTLPSELGHALHIDNEGRLAVSVANAAETDNTLPITSAAVAVAVGNIDVLLAAI